MTAPEFSTWWRHHPRPTGAPGGVQVRHCAPVDGPAWTLCGVGLEHCANFCPDGAREAVCETCWDRACVLREAAELAAGAPGADQAWGALLTGRRIRRRAPHHVCGRDCDGFPDHDAATGEPLSDEDQAPAHGLERPGCRYLVTVWDAGGGVDVVDVWGLSLVDALRVALENRENVDRATVREVGS